MFFHSFGAYEYARGVNLNLPRMLIDSSLLLFLIFFPRATPHVLHTPYRPHTFRLALAVSFIYVAHLLGTLAVALMLLLNKARPGAIAAFATANGVLAAILTAVQYLPQLYTTYRLRAVGSLSIPMMLIQTPGGFLWAASLAARVGWAGWSLWGIYVLSGSLQGVLLAMALWFEFTARTGGDAAGKSDTRRTTPRTGHDEGGRDDDDANQDHRQRHVAEGTGERTPLLSDNAR